MRFTLYAASRDGLPETARFAGTIEGIGQSSARFRVRPTGRDSGVI